MALSENRFSEANYKRNVWNVILPENESMDGVLEPLYWAHVARMLRPMDRIEVFKEDGTEWCELLVIFVDRVAAKVVMLNHVDLAPQAPASVDPEYGIKWAGPHAKFRVVRLSDKHVVQDKLETAQHAAEWLIGYVKALAA